MSSLDTKFADMPEPVRKRWLDWARSHDWGQEASFHPDRGIYGCEEWQSERHGETVVAVMTGYRDFSTPREMRNWAGY